MVLLIDSLRSEFDAKYPEVPSDIILYLIEALDCKGEYSDPDDVFELVYPQVEVYYEEIAESKIKIFSTKLFSIMTSFDEVSPTLKKLTSTVAIDNKVDLLTNDILMTDVALPNRTRVDAKKLEKIKQQQEQKKKKAEEKDALAKENAADTGPTLATVSQANIQASLGNATELLFEDFDMTFGNVQLLKSASVQFNRGHRYGLVGRNGSGKSTFLRLVGSREFQYHPSMIVSHVEQELEACDTSAIESVLESDVERHDLLQRVKQNPPDLSEIYARLEEISADDAPVKAAQVLVGLGFTHAEQSKAVKEFSGGWRMRLALARALFSRPDVLLLDEPTNMLDMKAVLWLENYLTTQLSEKTILILVSHDRIFQNQVCNNIIHLHSQRLDTYRGDYDTFERTKDDRFIAMKKEYTTQLEFREHVQKFIDRFRFNANRAPQVQSRIKMLEKLPPLIPVIEEPPIELKFTNPEECEGYAVQLDEVSFRYGPNAPYLFEKICCGVDFDDKICIVGDNGAGKTTLLKLMLEELEITEGLRHYNRRCKVGFFSQHHVDQLDDMSLTPLQWMKKQFPLGTEDFLRSGLAQFQMGRDIVLSRTLGQLSGGQKSRVAFAKIFMDKPTLLVLDEPTNHLDIETVAALSEALTNFTGGVVLVSHDESLINKVCKTLWVCKNKSVTRIEGGMAAYKKMVTSEFETSGIRI